MDTATHFVMGFGLAGLAYLDPAVASSPGLAEAVMIGTVLGSQAPDLDGLIRFRGSAAYIRHHRGVSHSIPAIFLWSAGVFALIQWLMPQTAWLHLFFWILFAVSMHVLVDLFNSYGTKGYSPFSSRWIAYHLIFIFDPVIFGLHAAGLMAWLAGAHPGSTFLVVYLLLIGYYFLRYRQRQKVLNHLRSTLRLDGTYTAIPTINPQQWTFLVKTDHHWYVGEVYGQEQPMILDRFELAQENEWIAAAKQDPNVQALLSFSSYVHVECKEHGFGREVKWFDLRYRARHTDKSFYMLVAVVYLDQDRNIRDSYVGWVYRGEEQLTKKLDPVKRLSS